MAGIYIHIPFCKQACHYCNFHFSTSLRYKNDFITALLQEIELQKDYLKGETIESIYFGGGTPSLLAGREISIILDAINKYHKVERHSEITLEANPDDLNKDKLKVLKGSGINRLSIGVQSFNELDLKYMNRSHNAEQALRSLKNSLEVGFENISVDLIFGTPTLSDHSFEENLQTLFGLKIPHISCYNLTVEPKTPLEKQILQKQTLAVDETQSARQFELLMQLMQSKGYDHYEISNFCLPERYAKHNTNYWKGKKYLGVGPSAHSFNGDSRQWNVSNNAKYIRSITSGSMSFELEKLSKKDKFNERLMTGLRTKWGFDIRKCTHSEKKHLSNEVSNYIKSNHIELKDETLYLSSKGKQIADIIISDLFIS